MNALGDRFVERGTCSGDTDICHGCENDVVL